MNYTYREKLVKDYGEGKGERTIASNSCVCDYHAMDNEKEPEVCYKTSCANRWEEIENKDEKSFSAVDHPAHYGGDSVYETIKVIEAWGLDFNLGNAVKYISRAGKKDPSKSVEDLKKAIWYINHSIERIDSVAKN